jgi:hypothetical protein
LTPKVSLLFLRVTRLPPKRATAKLRGSTARAPSIWAATALASSRVSWMLRPGERPAKGSEVCSPHTVTAFTAQARKPRVAPFSSPLPKPSITTSMNTPQNTPQAVRKVRSRFRRRVWNTSCQ